MDAEGFDFDNIEFRAGEEPPPPAQPHGGATGSNGIGVVRRPLRVLVGLRIVLLLFSQPLQFFLFLLGQFSLAFFIAVVWFRQGSPFEQVPVWIIRTEPFRTDIVRTASDRSGKTNAVRDDGVCAIHVRVD